MIKAGVIIDDWKLEIFKRHLDANGYKYTQRKGITKKTITLMVDTESSDELYPVVRAANDEAAEHKNTQQ